MSGPETSSSAPDAAPSSSSDLERRVQEVLSTNNVTAGQLRELRDMLQNVERGNLDRREELLTRVKERLTSLDQSVSGSETPQQTELRRELNGLQDRLSALEKPDLLEQGAGKLKEGGSAAVDSLKETGLGLGNVATNFGERVGEEWNKGWFRGGMSIALPVLSAIGVGVLAKKVLEKKKGFVYKAFVLLFGAAGVVAIANYSGKRAQAEMIDRQARRPVPSRVQEIIDAAKGGDKVDVDDPRLIDVDLFQLRGAPITVGGHSVRLERTVDSGRPVIKVAVGGNTFEMGILASTTVQSVTRTRGMVDIAVLLGVPTGHAYVSDAEFSRIASQLSSSAADTTINVQYFTDPSKPSETKKGDAKFKYVRPTTPAPEAATS